MAKPREFPIKESPAELKQLRRKQPNHRFEKRVIWLETILSKRLKTRKVLADYLDISPRTQQRWTKQYVERGIEGLLTDEPKNLRSRIITPEIHQGLSERVHSSTEPFLGYWEAQS